MSSGYRFALIGENISYSKSPAIFDAIYSRLEIDGSFELVSLSTDQLGPGIRKLVESGCRGLAVTIPHKEAIIAHLDEISPTARNIQAVNSVAIRDGRLHGDNTDVFGFSLGLKRQVRDTNFDSAFILGSGGAARAAIHSLVIDFGVRELSVWGRHRSRVSNLRKQFKEAPYNAVVAYVNTPPKEVSRIPLVINATPVGGPNQPETGPLEDLLPWDRIGCYYDLNYNRDNPLLESARTAGCTTVDGTAMLVGQAIRSFELWTSDQVDFDPVYQAVFG